MKINDRMLWHDHHNKLQKLMKQTALKLFAALEELNACKFAESVWVLMAVRASKITVKMYLKKNLKKFTMLSFLIIKIKI